MVGPTHRLRLARSRAVIRLVLAVLLADGVAPPPGLTLER